MAAHDPGPRHALGSAIVICAPYGRARKSGACRSGRTRPSSTGSPTSGRCLARPARARGMRRRAWRTEIRTSRWPRQQPRATAAQQQFTSPKSASKCTGDSASPGSTRRAPLPQAGPRADAVGAGRFPGASYAPGQPGRPYRRLGLSSPACWRYGA